MDIARLLRGEPDAALESDLRSAQQNLLGDAFRGVDELLRKSASVNRAAIFEKALEHLRVGRVEDPLRVMSSGPLLAWACQGIRQLVMDPSAIVQEPEVGTADRLDWPGSMPVYVLRDAPLACGKLTNEAAFWGASGRLEPAVMSHETEQSGRWRRSVEEALRTMVRYFPSMSEQFPKYVKFVVPLSVANAAPHFCVSVTSREVPGAIAFSEMLPLAQIETLVHEYRHNLLYAIQELDPLVDDENAGLSRSPWRPDPRPLSGVLHGAFAFEGILGVHSAIAGDETAREQNRAAATKRLLAQVDNLLESIATLDRAAGLTSLGRAVVTSLSESCESFVARAAELR